MKKQMNKKELKRYWTDVAKGKINARRKKDGDNLYRNHLETRSETEADNNVEDMSVDADNHAENSTHTRKKTIKKTGGKIK